MKKELIEIKMKRLKNMENETIPKIQQNINNLKAMSVDQSTFNKD